MSYNKSQTIPKNTLHVHLWEQGRPDADSEIVSCEWL